jgi:lipid II:glycine glycyltransferase (peptidoglycan interpeptide bridge formation enzyme)
MKAKTFDRTFDTGEKIVNQLDLGKARRVGTDPVVKAAQFAFSRRIEGSSDVSENTKNAQAIAKSWRGIVHELDPDRFQIEAMVAPALDQKIDIVDLETACAYEFKVSGKNAAAEFYKDVVKVTIWNQKRKKTLSSLVFITDEKHGRPFLDAPMPRAYIDYLAQEGLTVIIEYVRHG